MGAFDDLMARRLGAQTTEEDKDKKPAESQMERLMREATASAPKVDTTPNTEEQSIGGRIYRAAQRGVESLGQAAEGVGLFAKSAVGANESAQNTIESMRTDQAMEASKPQPLSIEQLTQIYKDEGLGAMLANLPAYAGEQLAQNLPSTALPLAAGQAVTKATGSLKAGTGVGLLTYALQTLGNNMMRQANEGADADYLKPFKAAGTAIATAPLGYFTDKFVMGLSSMGSKATMSVVAAEMAARSTGSTIFKGALKGLAEIPTEVLEQMGERYQADLDLFSDEAIAEYKEAAGGALVVGATGGALGSLPERNHARKLIRKQAVEERKIKLQEELTKNPDVGPPRQQRSLWEGEQAPPQMPDMPQAPPGPQGQQLELPFGQQEQPPAPPAPPVPPPPPAEPVAPAAPAAPIEAIAPAPAATVGPELESKPGTMDALIKKMRARDAKAAPTVPVPVAEVPVVPKETPSKIKVDVQPHVFTEEGEPIETKGKPKSFGVANPEVFPPAALTRPAVLLRDGTVVEGPIPHDPIKPNAPNAEKEATAESIVKAQEALKRKLKDMGVTRGEIAFHRVGEEDMSPAFGWVVDTPESAKTGVPTFVSRQEYENAKNLSDKVMAPAFKNKTDEVQRTATAKAKAGETAAKYAGVDAAAVEDMVKKHTQLVNSVQAKAAKSIGFSRPSFDKGEIKSAVAAATARVAAETDLATKGMSPKEKADAFKKNFKKIQGLALNMVEESQGKRRAVEAQMKEGTLNPVSMDVQKGGEEGLGSLKETIAADGTSTSRAPKVSMVPAVTSEQLPKPVRKIPVSKATGETTRALNPKEKVKYQKRLDKLVNQYNAYSAKHPELTQQQIFDHFKANPNLSFRWGDKSVEDYKAEAERRKSAPIVAQATVQPQDEAIVPKATPTMPKTTIVERKASRAVDKQAKAKKPAVPAAESAVAPKLTGGAGDVDAILAAVDAKAKPIGTSIADLKAMRAKATEPTVVITADDVKAKIDTIKGELNRGRDDFVTKLTAYSEAMKATPPFVARMQELRMDMAEVIKRAIDKTRLPSGAVANREVSKARAEVVDWAGRATAELARITKDAAAAGTTKGLTKLAKPFSVASMAAQLEASKKIPVVPAQANTKVRAAKAQVADRLSRMKELAKEANKVLGEEGGSEGSIQMDKLKPIFKEMYNESKALGMDVATFVAEVSKMVGEKTMGAFRQWVDTDLRAELTAPKTATAAELLAKMRKKQEKPAVTGTKVVDAAGKPMKMYHASSTPIREFKSGKQVSWYSTPLKGEFGEHVAEAHLDIKNPAPSLNEWMTHPEKYDGLFYAAEDYEGKPGFLARVKDPSQIKILNKPADTKADKMVRPRLTGKTAAKEADVQSVFKDMIETAGIPGPALQEKLIKYGTDTNSLVVKADGNPIYLGYKGIEFGKLRDPNIADGLIVPVGLNQYVVFKPEVPGQTPSAERIATEAAAHTPLPGYVAPVSKQTAPLGSKVSAGKTVAEMMGKPKAELTEDEYLATLPPDEAQKMRDAIHAPTPEPKAEPAHSPALVEHLAATARIVLPSKMNAFKQWMADNRVTVSKSTWAQTAFSIKGGDDGRVVQTGPNEYLIVSAETLEAYRTGTKPPKKQATVGDHLATDAEITKKNIAKYGIRAPAGVDYSKVPAAQKADLSRFAIGDVVPAQHSTMFEATFISGENAVIEVVGTKKDAKTEFLQKVRDKGKDLKATRVVVTQAVGGKPSLEHQVIRHSEVQITPMKLSEFIANEKGSTQFLIDVADFVITLPKQVKDSMRDMWHRAGDLFSVEEPWTHRGMPEIGFAVKNINSIREMEERRGIENAEKVQIDTARRFKAGGKTITRDDMTNIILVQENTGKTWDGKKLVSKPMSEEWMRKAQPTIDWINTHLANVQRDFRRRGVDLDFIGNQRAKIKEKMENTTDEVKKAHYQELFDSLENVKFVHIPYQMLFQKKVNEYIATNSASEARKKMAALRTILNRHRKAPTIASLLEPLEDGSMIVDPHDICPAMVIMNYAANIGREHAMLDLRDAIKSYGDKVVKIAASKPKDTDLVTWQKNPINMKIFETMIPKDQRSTHQVYISTDLVKALQDSLSFSNAVGRLQTTLAWVKMAAFFNPVMMPMYNTYQLAMGGILNPITLSRAVPQAYRDIGGWKAFFGREYGTRTDNYYDAAHEGVSSQPYANPHSSIEAMARGIAAKTGDPMTDLIRGMVGSYVSRVKSNAEGRSLPIKALAPVKAALAMVYEGSNVATWVGDEFTRMIAYNYLREKGHSTRDAAQMTAMMLGDYAGVPASTRRVANMFLFTPTYKISMFKFWAKMIKSLTSPKVIGSFVNRAKTPELKVDRRYLYAGLASFAVSGMIRRSMEAMGYEEDEFLRRWVRSIKTAEGRKELVFVLSSPLNIVWKYGYTLKKILTGDAGSTDSLPMRLWRAAEMELHPLWKSMIQLARNETIGRDTIIHPLDPPSEKIKHFSSFAIETLAPVVNFAYGKVNNDIPWEGKSQKLARDAYSKEAGPFMNNMMDLFAFKYIREIPEIRHSKELKRLATELPKQLIKEKKENGTIRRDWIENYKKRSAEVILDMKKGK